MHTLKTRDFKPDDIYRIDPNMFSGFKGYEALLHSETTVKRTLEVKGVVECILVAVEYSAGKFKVFLIASETFNMQHAICIRDELKSFIVSNKADRIETESEDCDKLNRWHAFLGFKLEGRKRKYVKDRDFNVWGIVHGD